MKKLLLMAALLTGMSANAQEAANYTYVDGTPVAVSALEDGKTYFVYDGHADRYALRYNRQNSPYNQIVGEHVQPTAGQLRSAAYVWVAEADGSSWKFRNLADNSYIPVAGASGNVDLGSTTAEQAGSFNAVPTADGATSFYMHSTADETHIWDGNGSDGNPPYCMVWWYEGNGHPYSFYEVAQVTSMHAVTINFTRNGVSYGSVSTDVPAGVLYSTPAYPASVCTLDETLTDATIDEDKTINATLADDAALFKLVNARFNTDWASSSATGLPIVGADNAEWFVNMPAEGGFYMYSFIQNKYAGSFSYSNVPMTDEANRALLTIEHNQNGPVAIKGPQDIYFNNYRTSIGGWSAGSDAGSYWFMVSDEEAYAQNAPYFWNDGEAVDNGSGNFNDNNEWYVAQQNAKDALSSTPDADATAKATLEALLEEAAVADFGAAGTNIGKMIEDIENATKALTDPVTGIREINAGNAAANVAYDLQGRRVNANAKGLIIQANGKKIVR